MARITRANRKAIEDELFILETDLEALHDPDDHEGEDSEVNGVMKCKGCQMRHELWQTFKHQPELEKDLDGKKRVVYRMRRLRDKEALPRDAATKLNRIASSAPGIATAINQMKQRLGL